MHPEMLLGQIREGCEIAISPREWQRLPAHLPNWSSHQDLKAPLSHQDGFASSVLSYFKGHQHRTETLDFGPQPFRLVPCDDHGCSFTYSENPQLIGANVRLRLCVLNDERTLEIDSVHVLELPSGPEAEKMLKCSIFVSSKCNAKLGDRAKIIGAAATSQHSDCNSKLHHDSQLSHKSCQSFLCPDDIWLSQLFDVANLQHR